MLAQTGRLPPPTRSAIDKRANAAFFAPAMTDDMPRAVRNLLRGLDRASLATALLGQAGTAAWPYASLVLASVDHDLAPILLLSNLAEHTKAIAADSRVCLLFDGTAGLAQPLTGPRVSLLGRAARTDDERLKRRFLAHHPDAAMYAGFGDFNFYRVAPERAHLVGGFGKIRWLDLGELLPGSPPAELIASEADIVEHMNADHADAVQLYAGRLLGLPAGEWRMTGIDAEGLDLRSAGQTARLGFEQPIATAVEARKALIALVAKARGRA
jgi:heme oxygenase (biliverdin-IX-beta and delta-forming)